MTGAGGWTDAFGDTMTGADDQIGGRQSQPVDGHGEEWQPEAVVTVDSGDALQKRRMDAMAADRRADHRWMMNQGYDLGAREQVA